MFLLRYLMKRGSDEALDPARTIDDLEFSSNRDKVFVGRVFFIILKNNLASILQKGAGVGGWTSMSRGIIPFEIKIVPFSISCYRPRRRTADENFKNPPEIFPSAEITRERLRARSFGK